MHVKLIIENKDQKILMDTKWGVYTSPRYIKGEKIWGHFIKWTLES